MKYLLIIFSLFLSHSPHTLPKDAYQIYNKEGEQVTYAEVLKTVKKSDVVLFGELHDNPIAHWLELELTKDLFEATKGNLMLGAEMLEADNQMILNEYLSGKISQKNFEKEARLWNNYKTDYKPLVEFAKENNTGFVASNIPRRYASMVYYQGLNSLNGLSKQAKQFIAPLPIEVDLELPNYKALLEMGGEGHDGVNFVHAQAVKDATMAHFISKNLVKKGVFIHYNGAYHSDNYEGINWYIEQYAPKTKVSTISTVTQDDISSLNEDYLNKADFIICIPESMTRTY